MIYYFFRNTKNWNVENKKRKWFFENDFYWGTEEKRMNYADYINYWNYSQSISWFEYRQMLKDIASDNLSRSGLVYLENCSDIKEDDWFVPIDDDDWFYPPFKKSIEACDKDFIYGDVAFCCFDNGTIKHKKALPGLLGSVYAFRGWFLFDKTKQHFHDHIKAKQMVKEHDLSVSYSSELSSYYLQHPGSASYMSSQNSLDDFKRNNRIKINIPVCDCDTMAPCFEAFKKIKDTLFNEEKLSNRMRRIYLFA